MKATHAHVRRRYLDVPRLVSWLSSRQNAPEGGFCGRTNKLVDSCYSQWVGGCWPLIEAVLCGRPHGRPPAAISIQKDLPANNESLFHREGLIRYILCCCQDHGKRGGLRDKPNKSVALLRFSCTLLTDLQVVGLVPQLLLPFRPKHSTASVAFGHGQFEP